MTSKKQEVRQFKRQAVEIPSDVVEHDWVEEYLEFVGETADAE